MNWFKKIGYQTKLIFGSIIAFLSFIIFFLIRARVRAKQQMDYQLAQVESRIKLAELKKDSVQKNEELAALKKEEALIKEKIKYIKEKETLESREVTLEELDQFFKDRGF